MPLDPYHSDEKFFLSVDIGSNAMRASIACLDQFKDLEILSTYRYPLRLGEDVFKNQKISNEKMDQTVEAFHEINDLCQAYSFENISIVATSAIRDANNGDKLIQRVLKETGHNIKIINGETEAEFIYHAVKNMIDISHHRVLMVDIGGGSTELTLTDQGEIVFTKSYNCGTVRLLESGQYKEQKSVIKTFIKEAKNDFAAYMAEKPIELCVGTGGNLRRMGKLRKIFFRRSNLKVSQIELSSILSEIKKFSLQQRVDFLDMRSDRADVIVPASKIIEELLLSFHINEIHLPKVGLKEGVILNSLEQKPRFILFN